MSKNIIILQHIDIETPGYILDLMQEDNFNLTTIELDEGEKIPSHLEQFDGMFCMGGPMDTWMEKDYPWLIDEKKKIKEFVVDLKKPYLGFCLGCQLLGEVIGGKVVKSKPPEIGILDISMSDNYLNDHIFNRFHSSFKALQWQGTSSHFWYFENENHWVLNPQNLIVRHESVIAWIRQWTSAWLAAPSCRSRCTPDSCFLSRCI